MLDFSQRVTFTTCDITAQISLLFSPIFWEDLIIKKE